MGAMPFQSRLIAKQSATIKHVRLVASACRLELALTESRTSAVTIYTSNFMEPLDPPANVLGMGRLQFESVARREYDIVMTTLLLSAVRTLVGVLISDILYVLVIPRVSFEDSN